MSTWLFIILFGTSGAQVIEMQSLYECEQLKVFTKKEADKANIDVALGCFKNMGRHSKES